jgi:hypothetical protein
MAGYIGANTSSVTNNQNAAERRKKFTFTANTTALTGLSFLPNKIHIFHNGIRLVKDTDFTEAADGQSVTLVNAAQAGDEVVAVTFEQNPAVGSSYTDADVDARLLKTGNILPDVDNASDLGSTTKRFQDLHLSGGVSFDEDPSLVTGNVDSKTLSDFETGDWTPSLGGNASYDIQYGRYEKVGNLVYVRFAIRAPTLGTGSTYIISGLPYTASSEMSGLSVGYYDGAAVNFYAIVGAVEGSAIGIYLKTSAFSGALQSTNFFQNNTRIYASAVYRTT